MLEQPFGHLGLVEHHRTVKGGDPIGRRRVWVGAMLQQVLSRR